MAINFRTLVCMSLVAVVATFFSVDSAYAQGVKAKGGNQKIAFKLKSLSKPDKSCLVASPEFDGRVKGPGRDGGRNKRWASLEASYVSTPDWIDEITFTFHVMSQDSEKTFHYFTTAVSYLNVAKGEHGACVMLPPSAVARFGMPCAFGVEVSIDGDVVGADSEGMGKGTPWWNKLESMPKLKRHSGLLTDRSKTPFGMTFIDEYEAVR